VSISAGRTSGRLSQTSAVRSWDRAGLRYAMSGVRYHGRGRFSGSRGAIASAGVAASDVTGIGMGRSGHHKAREGIVI